MHPPLQKLNIRNAMVRKSLLVAFLLVCFIGVKAQFSNKDIYISPKISFADYSDRNDWNGYSIHKVPPISLTVERGVTDFLSVGALVGYSRDKYVNDTLSSNRHVYSDFSLGTVTNVHFAGWIEEWTNYKVFLGDWDFYAGLGLLFKWQNGEDNNVWNDELKQFESNKSSSFNMKLRPLVGVRYFVTDNFCMLVEVGHGNLGLVTTGITLRIPNNNYN
jgi:hypothetical protein